MTGKPACPGYNGPVMTSTAAGAAVGVLDPTFVGRSRELELFRAALDDAGQGRRQIVLLSGEPGIGKTRLAEMFARVAENEGALVLWGRCYEEPGAPPYWPWVQVLREYVASSSRDELRLTLGAGAEDISAILPELFDRGHARSQPAPIASDHARFRTFDTIARLLDKASQSAPVVLILDNLHWSDTPSLALLEFLSQELARSRVLVIGTYRDIDVSRRSPLSATLGGLSREAGVERLKLGGLPQPAVSDLARCVLGAALPDYALDAIHQQTDGNPLFVIELLKLLREESARAGVEPIAVRIPDGVREAIGRRLSTLSDSCNELLAVAAVLGRHFTATEVATVADAQFQVVLEALETAARAGLIETDGPAADAFRFTHALIREVLHEELPTLERLKLHGRAGDALRSIHGADVSALLTTIAHHYHEAAPLGFGDQAIDFALRAADHATGLGAYEDAVFHYERAITVLTMNGLHDDQRLATAHYLNGCALTVLGNTDKSLESLMQCVKYVLRIGNGALLVDALTRLAWTCSYAPQTHVEPLLRKALAILPDTDSAARAKALATLAFATRSVGQEAQIEPLVDASLAMAQRLGDQGVLCACLRLSTMALRGIPSTLPRRLDLGRARIAATEGLGNDDELADAFSWHALDLIEAAQFDEIERLLERYRQLSVGSFGLHQYYVNACEATIALMRGHWKPAEERIEALRVLGERMRSQDALGVHAAQMFTLARDLGRLGEHAPDVERYIRAGAPNAWIPGLMLAATELGLLDDARRYFAKFAEREFSQFATDDMYVTCLVYTAETCAKLGEADAARILYRLLQPYAGTTANHPRAVCFGFTDLYLALLSATSGDDLRARQHFEAAVAGNRAIAAWPWLARTFFHFGDFLLASDAASDQTRGRALLADAEKLAATLGMVKLVEEISAALASPADAAYPDGLTAREMEVLGLLAIGRSNKDISTVLAISLNTVATHVRSILAKTGCANRTEAAAYAMRVRMRESA
jgi:DNA-binding CsgD family transcriptional regulator/tetratricopeptide (TPR) repeat protein